MTDGVSAQDLADVLAQVEGLRELPRAVLDTITDKAVYADVPRGAELIREGDAANTLYVVLKGRFTVFVGGRPIAEISAGEPIGELAFFAGGTRTASVRAARNSAVLSLSRTAYDAIAAQSPALTNGILAAVARRLARVTPASPGLRPQVARVAAVFPGAGGTLDPRFVAGLRDAFEGAEGWRVFTPDDCDSSVRQDRAALANWLDRLEAQEGHILLISETPDVEPVWQEVVEQTADTVLVVLDRARQHNMDVSLLEARVFDMTLAQHVHLVLARAAHGDPTQGAAGIVHARPHHLHHHVALDSPQDFARLGRFIRGETRGLVMCGGGSFGTAHLGAIKALSEHGVTFDMVGGTSVGSAMAGALCMGLDPDNIMAQCEDIFLRSKAMSRLTVPRHALLDHHVLDDAFRKHYGAYDVEDLPLNFFAVSTSLTDNDVRIIRTGPLWQAIRASTAIPGVFPPFFCANGEVLIDGGLMDNVPLNHMRDLKPGPNVVLNFMPGRPWFVRAKYEDLPTRMQALGGLLRPTRPESPTHPTAFAVLARAMVVNARKRLREVDIGTDVLIEVSVLKGMSFLNWKRGRELFEASYTQTKNAIEAAHGNDLDTRLRDAADIINRSRR